MTLFCIAPIIIMSVVDTKQPELIINMDSTNVNSAGSLFTVDMPSISVENGPFRLVFCEHFIMPFLQFLLLAIFTSLWPSMIM